MIRCTETYYAEPISSRRAEVVEFVPVPTKRENPCDTCQFAQRCADKGLDCFAFRRWSNCGDYADKQINRLTRPFDQD